MLRTLAADHLQHGARGVGADARGDRPRVVVGLAQGRRRAAGDLELPGSGDDVDGTCDDGRIGAGVLQGGPRRGGGEVDRRHAAIAGIAETFGELTDADDDRGTGIDHDISPDRC
jgi:hypothetical protein